MKCGPPSDDKGSYEQSSACEFPRPAHYNIMKNFNTALALCTLWTLGAGGCSGSRAAGGLDGGGSGGGALGGAGGALSAGRGGDIHLVDDLEDNDLEILPNAGRAGGWYAVNDGTEPQSIEVRGPGASGSKYAIYSKGTGTTWGAGVGVSFNGTGDASAPYDASACTGISFWAKSGHGESLEIRVSVPDRHTNAAGGVCSSCWDHLGTDVTVDGQWQLYSLDFSQMSQQGFGDPRQSLDSGAVYGVQFTSRELDLWVDELRLTGCDPGNGSSGGRAGTGGTASGGSGPIVAPEGTPVERHGQLQVNNGKLTDADGDPVQLKGISSMWLNWENDGFAENKDALLWMRDNWNLEVIRAAMGIEPAGAYLSNPSKAKAQVRRIVDNALELGVYVIIDWHDHNAHNHTEEAVAFFTEMAELYGEYPNVIYEPFNEPLRVSWSQVLKPYHETVVAAIRDKDPDNIVILGTPQWSQLVDEAALDPLSGSNLMYTLHFYACSHKKSLRDRADLALARGIALFVTEWGATHADGGLDGVVCEADSQAWHTWMDANDIGWAAWKLDNCAVDSSCLLKPNAPDDGGWTDEWIRGHAAHVRAQMLR